MAGTGRMLQRVSRQRQRKRSAHDGTTSTRDWHKANLCNANVVVLDTGCKFDCEVWGAGNSAFALIVGTVHLNGMGESVPCTIPCREGDR
jgi:hypothetical protein